MSSKPTVIARILAFWSAYLLVFSWLPLVRCAFDGETYQWGTSHFGFFFSAAGLGPDVWLLVLKSIILVYLMWGLLRGSDAVHRAALVLWNLAWPIDGVLAYLRNPEAMMFHGDTLGIHLNLGIVVPAVTSVLLVLTLIWAVRESKGAGPAPKPSWVARNLRLLVAWALLLPFQFVLLRFGAPHGTTDAIGVFLTIAQCPLLALGLYPWKA